MRRIALACLLLSTLGCFEDLGPLPTDDDIGESSTGTAGTESESGDTGSSDSSSDSSGTESSDGTDAETTDGSEITGVYQPCGPGLTCDGGGTCRTYINGWFVFNICVPINCTDVDSCPPPAPEFGQTAYCQAGQCLIGCDNNSACGPGLVCATDVCHYNLFWGPCSVNGDCPMDSECAITEGNNSACLPVCTLREECPVIMLDNVAAPVCVANRCEIPCVSTADCPMPMLCDTLVCRYPGQVPDP